MVARRGEALSGPLRGEEEWRASRWETRPTEKSAALDEKVPMGDSTGLERNCWAADGLHSPEGLVDCQNEEGAMREAL
ncbi:hypothetical protein NDU88_003705 [Pleurodeles waltl]|uniref:Uncharacterized protein n=1 Tax=Pleurodeles waltl TaxID=8319 RepID=A0AAV7W5F2_PLEWA|nr:hypothetical protein NDU88_003705 [Pleurodeles waltl]